MAVDMNHVALVGRLTRDPESKEVNGKQLVEFSLAVNGWNDTVSFFDVKAWEKTASVIERFAGKGKQVAITGRLAQERWEAPDGAKRSKVTITASSVQLLGSKDEEQKTFARTPGDDEVPF